GGRGEGLERALGLRRDQAGVVVNRVRAESPADRAGLRRGDLVTRLDGHAVATPRAFFEILATATPEQTLDLDVWREGQALKLRAKAEAAPDELVAALLREKLGLELRPAPGGGYAVSAVRAGSGAERIGIRPGGLGLGINGRLLDGGDPLRRARLHP